MTDVALLEELNLNRMKRTRDSAIAQMEHALQRQPDVRRVPDQPSAYCVADEARGVSTEPALWIARWQSSGRCLVSRLNLREMEVLGITMRRFTHGHTVVNAGVHPDTGKKIYEYKPTPWLFDLLSYDAWPEGQANPYEGKGTPESRRQAASQMAQFGHTWGLNPVPTANDDHLRYQRRYYSRPLLQALLNHMPPGYALLSNSPKPRAYKLVFSKNPRTGDETGVARVASAKVKQKEGGIGDSGEEYLRYRNYPIYGSVLIAGIVYHVANDRKTLYIKGGASDIYTAPTQITQETTLSFYERAPADALRVPGELAWFEVDGPRRIVRLNWYLHPTGEHMEEVVGISGGAITWRGVVYHVTPLGALIPAVV